MVLVVLVVLVVLMVRMVDESGEGTRKGAR
jgi:hypothetical protein